MLHLSDLSGVNLGPPDEHQAGFSGLSPSLGMTVPFQVARIEAEEAPNWKITGTTIMDQAQALGTSGSATSRI
jgi:hypothetical protein